MGAAAVYAGQAVHGVFSGGEQHEQQEDTRPPQLDASSRLTDNIAQNWRWLSLRCERRLAGRTIPGRMGEGAELDNLNQFACFVPRTVLEAIKDNRIRATDDFDIIIERFNAAVVFCDASGFTALTEALDKQPNGAEKLGQAINSFFTPLIQTVDKWGGDIIKFSGDALTIVWPCDDEAGDEDEDDETFDPRGAFGYDEEEEEPPPSARRIEFAEDASAGRRRNSISGKSSPERRPFRRSGTLKTCGVDLDESSSSPPAGERGHRNSAEMRSLSSLSVKPVEYRVDKRQATMLAVQCCLELHEILHNFPTPIPDKFFTLHIGVGFGEVTILQVGGTLDRWEYVVAGPPLQQISVAEPLASSGETVLSPQAVDAMGAENGELDVVLALDGTPYFKVLGLKGQSLTPPPPLEDISLQTSHISLVRRFIPPAIFTQLTSGYNVFVNELRMISVVFVGVRGLDVSNDRGSGIAHKLMQLTQKAAYTMEGSVNKFLVDDKGVLILIMFGLPPVFHLDDPIRAVMASMRVADGLKELRLNAGIGVASGRVWCGTVGCDLRKEYTAMGDSVNLSARLMGKADKNEIFVDLETKKQCEHSMEFRALEPVMMKGKQHPVPLFQPTGQMKRGGGGVSEDTLASWPDWKPRKLLQRVLSPPFQYRPPVVGLDKPPLDFSLAAGPTFPWETVDPWMPTLQRLSDAGGVIVIRGKEGMGTGELADILREKVQSELNRTCFYCSNMPDATHVNIGNVPLLAWRKVCTDMIEKWRNAKSRDKKGFSKVDRDNSVYGLAKELLHPIFHWRMSEMKSVIGGLILPSHVDNQYRHGSASTVGRGRSPSESRDSSAGLAPAPGAPVEDEQSLAPIICSLVNGFTMYEPAVLVLHVRSGTSVYASMDAESWKVARLVGRLAVMRRRRKVELGMKGLKQWRRQHSRNCMWCRGSRSTSSQDSSSGTSASSVSHSTGYGFPPDASPVHSVGPRHHSAVSSANPSRQHPRGAQINPLASAPDTSPQSTARSASGSRLSPDWCYDWSPKCRPDTADYFPSFIFVLVCSDETDHITEQQELIQWAKECNAFIPIRQFTPNETQEYLAHCLDVLPSGIPESLVRYIHRVSAGTPRFIHLTQKMFVADAAIRVIQSSSPRFPKLEDGEAEDGDATSPFQSLGSRQLVIAGSKELSTTQIAAACDGMQPDAQRRLLEDLGCVSEVLYVYEFAAREEFPLKACNSHKVFKEITECGNAYVMKSVMKRLGLMPNHSHSTASSAGSETQEAPRRKPSLHQSHSMQALNKHKNRGFSPKNVNRSSPPPAATSEMPNARANLPLEMRRVPSFDHGSRVAHPRLANQGSGSFSTLQSMTSLATDMAFSRNTPLHPPTSLRKSSSGTGTKGGTTNSRSVTRSDFSPFYIPPGPAEFRLRAAGIVETMSKRPRHDHHHFQNGFQSARPKEHLADRNVEIMVDDDFSSCPFVPELRAFVMSIMERLQPEEQLAVKCAVVFPVNFTCFELQAVYPQHLAPEKFAKIMTNLLKSQVVELGSAPTDEEINAVRQLPGGDSNMFTLEDAETHRTAGLPTNRSSASESALPSFGSASPPTRKSSGYAQWKDISTPDASPMGSRRGTNVGDRSPLRTSESSVRFEERRFSGESTVTDMSASSDEDDKLCGADGSLAIHPDGTPIFYQFKSIAFQSVIGELLMSEERDKLVIAARAAVCTQRDHGFGCLVRYAARRLHAAQQAQRASLATGRGQRGSQVHRDSLTVPPAAAYNQ